eukprot:superscaffoldBa00001777_g11981
MYTVVEFTEAKEPGPDWKQYNVRVLSRAGAVRKNEAASSAPDSEIDSYAIRWFNLVSDRGGGRNDRAKVKEALTTVTATPADVVGSLSLPSTPRLITLAGIGGELNPSFQPKFITSTFRSRV